MSVHIPTVLILLLLVPLTAYYARGAYRYHMLIDDASSSPQAIDSLDDGDAALIQGTVQQRNTTFTTPLSGTEAVSYLVGERNTKPALSDKKRYNTNDHLHHVYSPFTIEDQTATATIDPRQPSRQDEDPLRFTWARRKPKVVQVEPTVHDEGASRDDLQQQTLSTIDEIDDFNGPYRKEQYERQYTEYTIEPNETVAVLGRVSIRDDNPRLDRTDAFLIGNDYNAVIERARSARRKSLAVALTAITGITVLLWAAAPLLI